MTPDAAKQFEAGGMTLSCNRFSAQYLRSPASDDSVPLLTERYRLVRRYRLEADTNGR